jgi:hypothetical protein
VRRGGRVAGIVRCIDREGLPWLDPASYVLAPGGSFEASSAWQLTGGARAVDGNEAFHVHSLADSHSLALPDGSSAASPRICVGLEHPTLRLFARNTGSILSTLRIEVLFKDVFGVTRSLPVGILAGGPRWQPTPQIVFFANAIGSIQELDGYTVVAFRFTPQGRGGAWQIDDVYVDPFRGR